jgi:[ribosomal protein S5]-alanine N-acetyltransferase
MMFELHTPRLTLIPLSHQQLLVWHQSGRKDLEKILNLQPNPWKLELFYEQETQTAKFPSDYYWYTSWEIIHKDSSCSVGGIGFAGLPDDEGATEIGYALDEKFRGKGIATEAVQALSNWAFQDPGLHKLRAETPVDNVESQRVLEKNNFQKTGQKTIALENPLQVFTWERLRY